MRKLLLFLGLFCNLHFLSLSNDSLNRIIDVQVQKFRNILETVNSNYYRSDIDLVSISENAFESLLQSLDKFSNYFSASKYQTIKDSYKGSSKGVGVQFFRRGDSLMIFHVVKGSPADSAGLIVGDKIIYINHEYCIGKDANFANKKILESKNNIAVFTIKRGEILKEYYLPIVDIEIPSVVCKFKFDNDIGYIKVNRFSLETYREFTSAIDSLIKVGCKFFAIDLRANQGGYLDEVVRICKLFINKGDTVVVVSGKGENRKVHIAEERGKYSKYPVIVVVDENTASGGEIFASCMQDNDRAIILGSRTFGKGLVQRTWEFKDGSAFRLTTAEYVSPLGRIIQKEEVDRVDLEGVADMNLNDEQKKNIETLIKNFGVKTKLPTFITKKGRVLLGGGGVFPDYVFFNDTTPFYLKKLKTSGFMNDFVLRKFIEEPQSLSSLRKLSFSDFIIKFEILDKTINDFRQYLIQRNAFNETHFTNEFNEIVLEMKATLGYILYGDIGYYTILLSKDKVLNKVLELRKEAERLVN